MGYHLNRLDEPVFMAVSKPLLTEFGIHHRLESCVLRKSFCQSKSVLRLSCFTYTSSFFIGRFSGFIEYSGVAEKLRFLTFQSHKPTSATLVIEYVLLLLVCTGTRY